VQWNNISKRQQTRKPSADKPSNRTHKHVISLTCQRCPKTRHQQRKRSPK